MTDPGPAGQPSPHPPAVLPSVEPPAVLPSVEPPAAPAAGGAAAGQLPVPLPPAGPGVLAPFPAPPTEGRTARLWWGMGVGGLAVVLCCGAGVAAIVGLALTGTEALNEQARVVVGDYLDAVREQEYRQAYDMLCDEAQEDETPEQFTGRVRAQPPIASYQVGDVSLTDLTVPVNVTYGAGNPGVLRVRLEQDGGTGELEVCDVER